MIMYFAIILARDCIIAIISYLLGVIPSSWDNNTASAIVHAVVYLAVFQDIEYSHAEVGLFWSVSHYLVSLEQC